MTVKLYLSRRNLTTLLAKLDRVKAGGESHCMIIKRDTLHKVFPQSHTEIEIMALEDEEYYIDRAPGVMIEDLMH